MWIYLIANIVVKAAQLLALAAMPPLFSPAPAPSSSPLLAASGALLLLITVVVVAVRFRIPFAAWVRTTEAETRAANEALAAASEPTGPMKQRVETAIERQKDAASGQKEALAAAVLLTAAVVLSIVCAAYFRDDRGPLGRGVLWVAVPLWGGFATTAAAYVRRRLSDKRGTAPIVVLAAGLVLIALSSKWIFNANSLTNMWWVALRKDGSNMVAIEALTGAAMRARDYAAVQATLDRCGAWRPEPCACLALRSQVGIETGNREQALKDAQEAIAACPNTAAMRATLVTALAYHGDLDQAEQEASTSLKTQDDPHLHYALAVVYNARGRQAEATAQAKLAVNGGVGRNASLLLGMLAINAGDFEAANKMLEPLAPDWSDPKLIMDAKSCASSAECTSPTLCIQHHCMVPHDPEALYDLALVADKKNDYNKARLGYLATLRFDRNFASARYNLAKLTFRHGVLEESRHHVQQFAKDYPADLRNRDLARMLESPPPSR